MKSNIVSLFKVFLVWVSMDFLKNCLGMKGKLRSEIKLSNAVHIKNTNKALLSSYLKMNNMMKSHNENLYKNKENNLAFMEEYNNLGKFQSKKAKLQKKYKKNTYAMDENEKSSINSFSFKSLIREQNMESSLGRSNAPTAAAGTPVIPPVSKTEPGESWMEFFLITSSEFKNKARYPNIEASDNSIQTIKVNKDGWRENQAFNCTESSNQNMIKLGFFFRLTNLNIYYAGTKTDVNILGDIDFTDVDDVSCDGRKKVVTQNNTVTQTTQLYCIDINDRKSRNWQICTDDVSIWKNWCCRMKAITGQKDPKLCSNMTDIKIPPVNSEEIQIQPEVVIPLPSLMCNQGWNYKTNGKDWECICQEGKEQSPIDLPAKEDAIDSPIKPMFQYKEVGPTNGYDTIDRLVDRKSVRLVNENNLHISEFDFGKLVTLDGTVYRAEEVYFHTPSNHKIDGIGFPLEISIVHYGITRGDIAKQVVLSFVFEKKAGVYNQFLDDMEYFDLPTPQAGLNKRKIDNSLFIPKILYEAGEDGVTLMKPFSFYTYQGSLMFPPCTERTINLVNSQPLRIGSTMIKLLQEALAVPDLLEKTGDTFKVITNDLVPSSSRDIQPINARPIFHYDHNKYCPPSGLNNSPDKPEGHYEKIPRDVTQIFYVSGQKPSGIPGAFVISHDEAGVSKKKNEEAAK
jgi:carbonic anhydrase